MPRGVRVRNVARRALPALGVGLALLTVAAAKPASAQPASARPVSAQLTSAQQPLTSGPAHTGLAIAFARVHDEITSWGWDLPGNIRSDPHTVNVASLFSQAGPSALPRLRGLLQADLLVVAPTSLPRNAAAALRRLPGVVAAEQVDAARIQVDGKFIAMLGVNPAAFRAFAAKPTAESQVLWRNVAAGGAAMSYTMGKLDKLSLSRPLRVAGRSTEDVRVAGFGTVGIAGVDAVVSDQVARSLGIPAGNAIVVSAPHAELGALMKRIAGLLPHSANVAALVAQAPSSGVPLASGAAGAAGVAAGSGPGLSPAELSVFLKAAVSRLGLPYVWGAAGPGSFDCSGLVQWSLAQAGVVMPRVAVDQARAGPQVPLSQLQPGDLLFYHTDPTAPTYISHVAIYLGKGLMIQAPEPGMDVQIVPADFGSGFAGAVRVYPRVAAAAAASPVG
jgi:peptidoglycan DL-endopeptidase CwlO